MFKINCILIFLHAIIMSTHSVAIVENISPNAVPRIVEAVGGVDQLEVEVNCAVDYASSLRNNISASLAGFKAGASGLIAKLCFFDGICWADKMVTGPVTIQEGYYGIAAMSIVQQYCPNIPIVKYMGGGRKRLQHFFTEWMEGQTLHDKVFVPDFNYSIGTTIKIPKKIVTSLAEFVYNLTTCPIPREKSTKLINV